MLILALVWWAAVSSVAASGEQWSASSLAGAYVRGDGLENTYLTLEKDERCQVRVMADIGPMADAAGRFEIRDGWIHLTLQTSSGDVPAFVSQRLLPVRWDHRLYLIEESEILTFANSVNSGSEPRDSESGFFFFRRKDSSRPARGKPALPESWTGFLLVKSICGTVIRLLEPNKAEFSLGRDAGLRVGMVLHARVGTRERFEVTVTGVRDTTSEILSEPGDGPIKVGQEVCSRR